MLRITYTYCIMNYCIIYGIVKIPHNSFPLHISFQLLLHEAC